MVLQTYFGPPHSTADAFTNRIGCNPTGSMLRVLFSTASRTAEANFKTIKKVLDAMQADDQNCKNSFLKKSWSHAVCCNLDGIGQ